MSEGTIPTCKRKVRQRIVKEFRGKGLRRKKVRIVALLLAYIKRRSIHQHGVL